MHRQAQRRPGGPDQESHGQHRHELHPGARRPTGDQPQPLDRRILGLAAVLLCGAVPALTDATVVNVAVESLARDLGGGSVAGAQWVVTGYLLATTAGIPLVGWGLDRFGARALWTLALAVFAAGSALCGAAWSLESLVAFRIAAGVGGGLVLPLLQAIMADAAGRLRVGRAMLLLTVPGQVVMILAPVLGGLLIEALGWRWTFLAQVPLCVAAAVLGWWRVPPGRRHGSTRFDAFGFALLLPALTMLLYGLAGVRDGGSGGMAGRAAAPAMAGAAETAGTGAAGTAAMADTAATGAAMQSAATAVPPALWTLAGAALLAGFIAHALRGGTAPLLDLRLFAQRSFAVAAALLFVTGLSTWAPLFLLPLFYQRVLGADALDAGMLLAPQALGMALGMAAAGRLADRAAAARPLIVGGTALAVATTLPFALAPRGVADTALGAALLARGFGLGLAHVPVMPILYSGVARESIGHATSLASVLQRGGAAFGTAALAVVLSAQLCAAAGAHMVHPDPIAAALGAQAADPDALAAAFHRAFWWVVAFTALAWVPAAVHRPADARRSPSALH
ncbi:MAG TPA: MFS transporter [Longimicrobiales bacterium]